MGAEGWVRAFERGRAHLSLPKMLPEGTCGRAGGWGAGAGLCPTPCLDLLLPPASAAPSQNTWDPPPKVR